MSKLREFLGPKLEKHFPRLYCIQYVIRHSKDLEYVQEVLKAEKSLGVALHWVDPHCVYVEHPGKRYSEKNIYLFSENDYSGGFSTIYHRLLLALSYADHYGMIPVTFWDNEILHYNENFCANTVNALECFFEPTSELDVECALVSRNLVLYTPVHLCMLIERPFDRYKYSTTEFDICVEVQKKYIKLKSHIENRIEQEIAKLFGSKRILGIHLRGTSFQWGIKGYPIPPNMQMVISLVEQVFRSYKYEKIFIATDDQNIIDQMSETFGNNLIFFADCFRAKGHMPNYLCDDLRENHSFLLDYDTLRDIVALSYCRGLITDLSQTGFIARVMKEARDERYEYLNVLDNGYYEESTIMAIGEIQRLEVVGRQL